MITVICILTMIFSGMAQAQYLPDMQRYDIDVDHVIENIAFADINNDGIDELLGLGPTGMDVFQLSLTSYRQIYREAFSNSANYSFVINDFNNDSFNDLFIRYYILLNNGDGTFSASNHADYCYALCGDVNHDDIIDIIGLPNAPVEEGPIDVLLGTGDGNFQIGQRIISGNRDCYPMLLEDMNGDGNQDLVAWYHYYVGKPIITKISSPQSNYYVGIFYGNEEGGFQPKEEIWYFGINAQSLLPTTFSAGDFNNDGLKDILMVENEITILVRGQDGGYSKYFSKPIPWISYHWNIGHRTLFGDINHDSVSDIILYGFDHLVPESNNKIIIYLGKGDGTFSDAIIEEISITGSILDIKISDIDRDGSEELVMLQYGDGATSVISIFTDTVLSVMDEAPLAVPVHLFDAYPNPFNNTTTFSIQFTIAEPVDFIIHSLAGQVVFSKRISPSSPGVQSVVWNGEDMQGNTLSSGIYLYTVRGMIGNIYGSRKITLMK